MAIDWKLTDTIGSLKVSPRYLGGTAVSRRSQPSWAVDESPVKVSQSSVNAVAGRPIRTSVRDDRGLL